MNEHYPGSPQQALEAIREALGRRDEDPLAARLRRALDVAAAKGVTGFPHDDCPEIAAGSFLDLDTQPNESARRSLQLKCYAGAMKVLASEAPEFAGLADALSKLDAGIEAPLFQPRKLPRENKPKAYLTLALYAAAAFMHAARDIHQRGGQLSSDRVAAEVFGETRIGTGDYSSQGEPWLPLCGRSWRQARYLLEKGLALLGTDEDRILILADNGFEPMGIAPEFVKRHSALRADKVAAAAAWTAAGVKRSSQ